MDPNGLSRNIGYAKSGQSNAERRDKYGGERTLKGLAVRLALLDRIMSQGVDSGRHGSIMILPDLSATCLTFLATHHVQPSQVCAPDLAPETILVDIYGN